MRALVADGLGTIISREGEVLTRQCHATVRMLYPQVRAILHTLQRLSLLSACLLSMAAANVLRVVAASCGTR